MGADRDQGREMVGGRVEGEAGGSRWRGREASKRMAERRLGREMGRDEMRDHERVDGGEGTRRTRAREERENIAQCDSRRRERRKRKVVRM